METSTPPDPARLEAALAARVRTGDRDLAFGDLTAADARGQGERLSEVGAWGPLARVAKVAMAWKLLAALMDREGAGSVRELEPATVVDYAQRTWAIPPPDGMIEGIRG